MSFITNPLVYYPISGILWLWHTVFVFLAKLLPGADHPESTGIVWALAVVFLVVIAFARRVRCTCCCSSPARLDFSLHLHSRTYHFPTSPPLHPSPSSIFPFLSISISGSSTFLSA